MVFSIADRWAHPNDKWIIEGVWSTRDGENFMTEMSEIDGAGGMKKVFLPGISEPLSHFMWTAVRNDEGEIESWHGHAYGKNLTIFND